MCCLFCFLILFSANFARVLPSPHYLVEGWSPSQHQAGIVLSWFAAIVTFVRGEDPWSSNGKIRRKLKIKIDQQPIASWSMNYYWTRREEWSKCEEISSNRVNNFRLPQSLHVHQSRCLPRFALLASLVAHLVVPDEVGLANETSSTHRQTPRSLSTIDSRVSHTPSAAVYTRSAAS